MQIGVLVTVICFPALFDNSSNLISTGCITEITQQSLCVCTVYKITLIYMLFKYAIRWHLYVLQMKLHVNNYVFAYKCATCCAVCMRNLHVLNRLHSLWSSMQHLTQHQNCCIDVMFQPLRPSSAVNSTNCTETNVTILFIDGSKWKDVVQQNINIEDQMQEILFFTT